ARICGTAKMQIDKAAGASRTDQVLDITARSRAQLRLRSPQDDPVSIRGVGEIEPYNGSTYGDPIWIDQFARGPQHVARVQVSRFDLEPLRPTGPSRRIPPAVLAPWVSACSGILDRIQPVGAAAPRLVRGFRVSG